ncbi:VOC family protein [Pseudooceanicola nanhaiensis]|uniref:VOC family protein n=1 Tax=Pseudooceanicola nanhaiensis TaxID=375761 RepID=UPI001CD61497|nr:VOC family protein [Pseudooceanicola nanhaiensis]MCA0922851.1 VOC family protein [Pseudooceanicola nanhaiensis]
MLKGVGAMALASTLPQAVRAANSLPVQAPVHVGAVGLRTRDAEALAAWYRAAVGLQEVAREDTTIWMGAGGERLLALTEQAGLSLAGQREAGLFHTAFLLPSRRDLAQWIAMAIERQLPVSGTADHRVSEAIYLTDPEGNGVEIYADRPQDSWEWVQGEVQMGTYPLDVEGIMGTLGLLPPSWRGAPAGTCVGHVHLKVGDATRAGNWWRETLGFDAASTRDDAVFLSTGGYHHHVAVNEWLSAGAGRRPDRETGLDFVALRSRVAAKASVYEDDWGTTIRIS